MLASPKTVIDTQFISTTFRGGLRCVVAEVQAIVSSIDRSQQAESYQHNSEDVITDKQSFTCLRPSKASQKWAVFVCRNLKCKWMRNMWHLLLRLALTGSKLNQKTSNPPRPCASGRVES